MKFSAFCPLVCHEKQDCLKFLTGFSLSHIPRRIHDNLWVDLSQLKQCDVSRGLIVYRVDETFPASLNGTRILCHSTKIK